MWEMICKPPRVPKKASRLCPNLENIEGHKANRDVDDRMYSWWQANGRGCSLNEVHI